MLQLRIPILMSHRTHLCHFWLLPRLDWQGKLNQRVVRKVTLQNVWEFDGESVFPQVT
jgi:hypothetical protein